MTAAGWMPPALAKEFAKILPEMDDWLWAVTREIDAHPITEFRGHLKHSGFLRLYKNSVRLTAKGRSALADSKELWGLLIADMLPDDGSFNSSLSAVVLLHAATGPGRLDVYGIARTMTELGWRGSGGEPLTAEAVYPMWTWLWDVLGNVGRVERPQRRDRSLSRPAIALVRDALLVEV